MSVLNPVIDHLDLSTKHIYLAAGVREYHPVTDIYCEIRNLRRTNESYRIFDTPVTAFGGVPKGGGKYTSRYAQFNHGWKIVPEDISHDLLVTGEQITDDGQSGKACVDLTVLSPGINIFIQYEPPASELVKAADELAAIKRMAFDNRVAIDALNVTGKATTSIEFPAGTRQAPAADIATALAIANLPSYGFKELFLESDLNITGDINFNGFIIEGNNHVDTVLTIASEASVENVRVISCTLDNTTLDGNIDISECLIGDITYLNGHIHDSGLIGTMTLGGNKECVLANCYTVDQDNPAIIDMGGSGNDLAMPNYSGIIHVRNLHSDTEEIGIGINAGMVILEDTITAGNIIVAGNGILINNTTGTAIVNSDALINQENIARAVWDESIAEHLVSGSTGRSIGIAQFAGVITVSVNGVSGTAFPIGTQNNPVNNMADAVIIANNNGIDTFHFDANFTITGGTYSGLTFTGKGRRDPYLTFAGTTLTGCQFNNIEITGTVINGSILDANFCTFDNFSGARITCYECVFEGVIALGVGESNFYSCVDGVPGIGIPDIQVGPCNSLGIWNWNGGIRLSNISTVDTAITCMIAQGRLWVDETCVEGNIIVKGMADLRGTTGGTTIDQEGIVSGSTITQFIQDAVGAEIQFSSYEGGITIDAVDGTDSHVYPYGTPKFPCQNTTNSYMIRQATGLHTIYLESDLLLIGLPDGVLNGLRLVSKTTSRVHTLTIDNVLITNCIAENIIVTGQCKTGSFAEVRDCQIDGITNCTLTAKNCNISGGTYLNTELTDCHVTGDIKVNAGGIMSGIGIVFEGDFNSIDMQGEICTVSLDIASGYVEILNSVTGCLAEFNLSGGELEFNANCIGGEYYVEGHGVLYDNGSMVVKANNLISTYMPEEVWGYERT